MRRSPVYSPVRTGKKRRGGFNIRSTHPIGLWIGGVDYIGISITDKANVRAEIWALLFDAEDNPYDDATRIINIEASPYLNYGYELTGDVAIGYAVYVLDTAEATLIKAYRYFGKIFAPPGICTTNLLDYWDYAVVNNALAGKKSTRNHTALPGRYITIAPGQTITGLSATATIASQGGTAVIALSEGTLSCSTGGTMFDVLDSEGNLYACAEGSGYKIYPYVGIDNIGTMIGFAADDGDRAESLLTGHSLNQSGYSTVGATAAYLEPEGVTEIPAGVTLVSNQGHYKRTADRVNLGATAGATTALADFNDFLLVSGTPETFSQFIDRNGDVGLHVKRGADNLLYGTEPIFPVVSGKIYEITGLIELINSSRVQFAVAITANGTVLDSDFTDIEAYGQVTGPYRKFYSSGYTGNVAVKFNAMIAPEELKVSGIRFREITPVLKNDAITNTVYFWGDSLFVYLPYMMRGRITNGLVGPYGVGGETSSQRRSDFFDMPECWQHPQVIQIGTNNLSNPALTLRDIAAMVDALPHTNFLISPPPGGTAATTGSAERININTVRDALIARYGVEHVVLLEQAVIDSYNPDVPQDVIDYGNGITPSSLRQDTVHLNLNGYEIQCKYLIAQHPEFFQFTTEKFSSPQLSTGVARHDITLYAHCATMVGTETLSLPHLLGTETVVYKTGTAGVTVAVDQLSFTAGTLGRVLLSDGTDLIFQGINGSTGTTIYNVDGTERHGTLSAAVTFAAQLPGSYYAENTVPAPYYSNTSILTGNNSTFSGAGNWAAAGTVISVNGDVPGKMKITFDGAVLDNVTLYAAQNSMVVGRQYKIRMKIARMSGTGTIRVFTLSGGASSTYFDLVGIPADSVERVYEGELTVATGGSLIIGAFTSSSPLNGTVITVDDVEIFPYISSTIPFGDTLLEDAPEGLVALEMSASPEAYAADTNRVWFEVDGTPKRVDVSTLVGMPDYFFKTVNGFALYTDDIAGTCKTRTETFLAA